MSVGTFDRKFCFSEICLLLQAQKPKKNCEVESIKISYSFALFTSAIYLCMKNYEHIVLVTVRVSISNSQND